MLADPRATQGQASLEWLAVTALVAILVGVGATLAGADQVGRRVTREMARALCLVRQGDCDRDRDPCVVSASQRREGLSVDIAFVHLGDHRVARIERRSDGTTAVTLADETAFGVQGHAGVGASMKVAGLDAEVGVGIAMSATLAHEGGATWIVRTPAEADALLEQLVGGLDPPPADIVYSTIDLGSTLGATVEADALVHLDVAGARLSFDRRTGQRLDRRSGRRTLFARAQQGREAKIAGGVLDLADGAGGEVYAIELDASGRPLDLQVVATGAFGGSRDLPDVLQPVAGRLAADVDGDRVYEVTAHLDLTEAGNLAAAADLLRALRRGAPRIGAPVEATRALRRRLDERGTVEARVLTTETSSRSLGLAAALGGKVGVEIARESGSSRLVAAVSRGLDGQWLVREDCLPAA